MDSCRVICCETELWSSEGQQPDKEYLRYTVVGKIFFPHFTFVHVSSIHASLQYMKESRMTY